MTTGAGRGRGRGFRKSFQADGAFVGGDLAPQGFSGALDLLGADPRPGQLARQFARPSEADLGRHHFDHPRGAGRQRRALQTQGPVARTPPRAAGAAMAPSPFQGQRPQPFSAGAGPKGAYFQVEHFSAAVADRPGERILRDLAAAGTPRNAPGRRP